MQRLALSVCVAFCLCRASRAEAAVDERTAIATSIDWAYLYDGGVVPFVYGSLAVLVGAALFRPPKAPLLFSQAEGGAPSRAHREVPGWVVAGGAVGVVAGIGLVPSQARGYHFKGALQSLLTTTAITWVAKKAFGRHRPDHAPGAGDNSRQSFISGHSSSALATTTYLSLYLYHHVFDDLRGDAFISLPGAISYAALATVSILVPYERVSHNRHHIEDVIAGSIVGLMTSTLFFYWQEHRFQNGSNRRPSWTIDVDVVNPGVRATVAW